MVQQIIWSDKALWALGDELQYLENNFSAIEIKKFTDKVKQKVLLLQSNPKLGRKVGRGGNTYKTVINKRVVLYYHYKPIKKEIHILAFWNTLQNPKRLKI